MKRNKLIMLCAAITAAIPFAKAQDCLCYPDTNALENLIVEKYYVTGAGDEENLPEGSITYRVYVDMKPEYKLAIGGIGLNLTTSVLSSAHPLSIRTSPGGQFYNNPFGATFGDQINSALLGFNTVVLDSYLSMGAASSAHNGVILNNDTVDGSILTSTAEGFLVNEDGLACQPLTFADGLIEGTTEQASQLGISNDQLAIFGAENATGPFELFSGDGGQWFRLGGVAGPTPENRVLVGQFTVIGGTLEFEFNVQVLIPPSLQCSGSPACSWVSILYVAQSQPDDPLFGNNANLNYVVYQKDFLNYVDNGEACGTIVGLEEFTNLDKVIGIYPNPVTDNLRISFNEDLVDMSYSLIDITGKTIIKQGNMNISAGQVAEVNLSQVSKGTYILMVTSGSSFSAKKVVKL